MEKAATDLVMKFVLDQQPVWAECALDIPLGDTLMKDFLKHTGYDNYSNFFEVSSFDFGIALRDEDQSNSAFSQQAPDAAAAEPPAAAEKRRQKGLLALAQRHPAGIQDDPLPAGIRPVQLQADHRQRLADLLPVLLHFAHFR